MMVFRKVVLLLMMLAFYSMSVLAGNMVEVDRAVLKIPKTANLSTHVDFYEGKQMVRFAGGRVYGDKAVHFMCINKGGSKKGDVVWWSMDTPLESPDAYRGFTIVQYKDEETGRYFYGILCWNSMDTRYRSYLLGLNKDRTKMNEYINSDNFREHRELQLQSGLFEKDGSLYVWFIDWNVREQVPPVYYKLKWSEANQWIGYDYLGTQKP